MIFLVRQGCLLLFLFFCSSLFGIEEGIKIRFINRIQHTVSGQDTSFQVYITNQSPHPKVLVGHLDLPPSWQAVPANDILFHVMPNQNVVQTLVIKIPDYQTEGQFPLSYEVWGRENPNIRDKDTIFLHVEDSRETEHLPPIPSIFQDEEPLVSCTQEFEGVSISLTSNKFIQVEPSELFFVSYLIENNRDTTFRDTLLFSVPGEWQVVPDNELLVEIPPHETFHQVFAVKPPRSVLAKRHPLVLTFKDTVKLTSQVVVAINRNSKFSVRLEDPAPCYPQNETLDLKLSYINEGNIPLRVYVVADTDPCCKIFYRESPFEVAPQDTYLGDIRIQPNLGYDDEIQFVKLRVYNYDTQEILFQDTLTLRFSNPHEEDEDPYLRIESHVSTMALGDNGRHVLAIEWAGEGYINPERGRYLDFVFRVPTTTKNVIYGVDQRLYVGLSEPGWNLDLGDTVYRLSPLTQSYRYGRGGGFDLNNGRYTAGAHYTQNTYNNSYNPREAGCYLGHYPIDQLYVWGNYLHRECHDEPTSNIASLAAEYDFANRPWHTEIEGAKDFVAHAGKKDTHAYRFETRGLLGEDTWFDLEKIYAGSAYYGYYHHVDMFSGILDFPLSPPMRANLGVTHLKQNFEDFDEEDRKYDYWATSPRQKQYNANVSYTWENGASLTWNGLLFRAKDEGLSKQYDFLQRWAGFTATFCKNGWSVLGIGSWGRQHNYKTHQNRQFVQRYYTYLSKQISERLFTSIFYEGGNTNYYDAKPWRTSYGGSLGYRYLSNTYVELFLQRVHNNADMYELNQASLRLCHVFSNRHSIQASCQYFHYQRRYPNDFLFLFSYTVPFGMPVGKRADIGNVSGTVFDPGSHSFVSDALVSMGSKQCYTDQEGRFNFKNLKTGVHEVKTEILPRQIITEDPRPLRVHVVGGKTTEIVLPVTHACILKGEIQKYSFVEGKEHLNETKVSPLPGARIIVSRDQGAEIYTMLTNEKGAFLFTSLRPGNWMVRVVPEQLPERYDLNMNNIAFDLDAEDQQEVIFKLKPTPRTLQQLEE